MEVIDDGRDIRFKRKHQPFKPEWVRLPAIWIDRLDQSNSASTHKLAHRILMEAFKREQVGGQIVLSRKMTGLPCSTTVRAARELAKLGLIEIQQSSGKAIRVSIIKKNRIGTGRHAW
jgi:hypothetical protein